MTDIRKYIEGKTTAELLETQRNSVVGGDVHRAVTLEIQRIQQDTNNIQIANLIGEIKKLKEITDTNAQASNTSAQSTAKLSKVAIGIAIATLLAQVIFSIHVEQNCLWPGSVNTGEPGFAFYSGCYRQYDFGLFGMHTVQLPDYKVPIGTK